MLIIVITNVNNLDLDSVIQCLYLINNLQKSLINLYYIIIIRAIKLENAVLWTRNLMSSRSGMLSGRCMQRIIDIRVVS